MCKITAPSGSNIIQKLFGASSILQQKWHKMRWYHSRTQAIQKLLISYHLTVSDHLHLLGPLRKRGKCKMRLAYGIHFQKVVSDLVEESQKVVSAPPIARFMPKTLFSHVHYSYMN